MKKNFDFQLPLDWHSKSTPPGTTAKKLSVANVIKLFTAVIYVFLQ
jgi:hypothetical protein